MRGLILVNALALVAAAAWLARLTFPAAQAVRVRNAYLLRRGAAGDFAWTPARVPQAFRQERAQAPAEIRRAVDEAGISLIRSDWARAIALVGLLLRHSKADVPIRADLATTYAGIVNGGGYCSDFVRVYLAAARVAGLFCRQWAFSFDGFGGHGHTVVEVWDSVRERWSMLDVHNNVYAVRSGEDVPLDALALRDMLATAPERLEFRPASNARLGWRHAEKLLTYYSRGAREWYLWFGNDVVARERDGLAGALSLVSGKLGHRVSSALGRLPPIVVAATPDNDAAIARMESLRRRVRVASALVAVLAACLVLQGLRADA